MDKLLYFTIVFFLGSLAINFLIQAIILVRHSIFSRRNIDLERKLLRTQIDQVLAAQQFEKEKREFSWQGFRKFQIARKVYEGHRIFSFYLKPHDGKKLPPFMPGQYITIELHIPDDFVFPGGKRKSPKIVTRCYSLSDSPNHSDYYRITVKHVFPPIDKPEVPSGLASTYLHERLEEGDIVNIKAPSGNFYLDVKEHNPVVLIGCGVGITPLLSMVNSIVEGGSHREVWFFYGVRNGVEHIMKAHFESMAVNHPNVKFHICYSSPEENDVLERDYNYKGRVTVDLLKEVLPSSNFEYYLCGPPTMMEQIKKDLQGWGVPPKRILFELFGSPSVKKVTSVEKSSSDEEVSSWKVTFKNSNVICSWKEGAGTILELAEANQITIDSGCRAGNCGTCVVAVKSGETKYVVDHGAEPEKKSCLACISVPESDLVLDA